MDRYEIKKGFSYVYSWEARHDIENDRYFYFSSGTGCSLYEISKEEFDLLEDGKPDSNVSIKGRKLFWYVNDHCGPAYTIVFDDDYRKLAPWAEVFGDEEYEGKWPSEMVDAVTEVLDKENSELRKQKREKTQEENK